MYQADFVATDSEDWAEAIEFYDASGTCDASDLVPAEAEFDLAVGDRCRVLLRASTADGTILRPSQHIITWRFTPDQLRQLCAGNTYSVGLTMTTPTGTEQILTGTLSFIDGIVK